MTTEWIYSTAREEHVHEFYIAHGATEEERLVSVVRDVDGHLLNVMVGDGIFVAALIEAGGGTCGAEDEGTAAAIERGIAILRERGELEGLAAAAAERMRAKR